MGITVGSNIASLRAQRQLTRSSTILTRTFERLASGQRINRASDDAAGLAIAESFKKDVRVYTQAVRNVNDGASLLSIADATVSELSGIVIRMRELASQAGNGTYSPAQRKAIDEEAQALADEFFRVTRSAEFNGLKIFDGSLENGLRVQAGYGVDGSIHSTLGRGLGTGAYCNKLTYDTETGTAGDSQSLAVSLGDVNGDGVSDLVTAGFADYGSCQGQATVLLGIGDGTFSHARTFATDTGSGFGLSYAVSLGDVNGDGVLDLVTAGTAYSGSVQGQASVLLGRGDGTFFDKRTFATETGSGSCRSLALSLGDVNGDGALDLVTAGFAENGLYQGQASVLIGRGDGTFGDKRTFATETGIWVCRSKAVTLGDVNGDGALDLVTAGYVNNGTAQGQASVLLGRGDGTFFDKRTFATETGGGPSGSYAISLGDVNGDGILDLVTAGGVSSQGQASVLIGNGNGTFGNRRTFATMTGSVWGVSSAVSLGDVNGDGALDLVSAGTANNGSYESRAAVLIGAGDGTFSDKLAFATGNGSDDSYGRAVSLGDVNGDGVLDLVTAGYAADGASYGQTNVLSAVLREGIAPVLELSLQSISGARQAMALLDNKLNSLSAARGRIGAFQSRLSAATGALYSARENSAAAGGRITDVDVAEESSTLARTQILQQAGTAVLGQANQQPAMALQLLGR